MNDGNPALGISIFIIFILVNGTFYGFAAAMQMVNTSVIELKAKSGDKRSEKILKWMNQPTQLVDGIHLFTIIMNMLAGAFIVDMIGRGIDNAMSGGTHLWIYWTVAVVLVVTLTVFGIFLPKRMVTKRPERVIYGCYGIVSVLLIVISPITYIITKISNAIIRLLGMAPNANSDNITEEEIITMVNEGHEQGVLLASEAEMIANIFELADTEAQDIMTHRSNIIAIDGDLSVDEVFEIVLSEGNSRFPVFERDIDNVIGVLHFKDLIHVYANMDKRKTRILDLSDELLYEAHFITETHPINSLFKTMQSEKIHMAIVVDEYGQTTGLVTMEDILEEIVGNILDEHDEDEELIVKEEDGSLLLDGAAMLDDIEDYIPVEFNNEEYDTLNGFIISYLGKIPKEGEEFEMDYQGFRFKVVETDNKMIKKVRVSEVALEVAE